MFAGFSNQPLRASAASTEFVEILGGWTAWAAVKNASILASGSRNQNICPCSGTKIVAEKSECISNHPNSGDVEEASAYCSTVGSLNHDGTWITLKISSGPDIASQQSSPLSPVAWRLTVARCVVAQDVFVS
jgi:hypothetical protein